MAERLANRKGEQAMKIKLDQIQPSPRPIRTSWDEDKMNELAQSIKEQGAIVPIKVRPTDNRHYEIVYGHRRVEAMRRTGVAETDAIVEELSDDNAQWQALIENLQREDLSGIDKANALKERIDTGYSKAEVAARTGYTVGSLENILALANAPDIVKNELQTGLELSERHFAKSGADGLSREPETRAKVLNKARKESLSSRQVESVARSVAATKDPRRREMLLETPYSSFIHNPEMNRARSQEYGEYDPSSVSREPTQSQQWEATPEVKAIIDTLKLWGDNVPEMRLAVQQGKLAPEARAFILRRVERLIAELRELAIELE